VATNTRAIRPWERVGFSTVGRLRGADARVMFKQLVA
jgi:hypothetical protein